MQFPWSESYEVGNPMIDSDHRGLFKTINDLDATVSRKPDHEEVRQVIATLVDYVLTHFRREERLMREAGYPELMEHRRKHQDFSRTIFAIQLLYETEPEAVDLDKLIEFLRGWLVRHILGADRDYIPYLAGERDDEDFLEEEPLAAATKVTIDVPGNFAGTLSRCAEILSAGGDAAWALADYVAVHGGNTSLERARELAADVLSDAA